MIVAIQHSVSKLTSSDDKVDRKDEDDEEIEKSQLCKDDKPDWVMGTICKMVLQQMKRFWQNIMKLDKLTQPGLEIAANYSCKRDKKYGTSELKVFAVDKQQPDDDAAAPALTTFGDLMECHDIVPVISHMAQGSSPPGSSHIRL